MDGVRSRSTQMSASQATPGEDADDAANGVPGRVLSDQAWEEVSRSLNLSARELEILALIAFLIVAPWLWPFFYSTGDPLGRLLSGPGG